MAGGKKTRGRKQPRKSPQSTNSELERLQRTLIKTVIALPLFDKIGVQPKCHRTSLERAGDLDQSPLVLLSPQRGCVTFYPTRTN